MHPQVIYCIEFQGAHRPDQRPQTLNGGIAERGEPLLASVAAQFLWLRAT